MTSVTSTSRRVRRQTISEATEAAMRLVEDPIFQREIGCVLLGRWLDGHDLTIAQTAAAFFVEAQAAYDTRLTPEVRHLRHKAESQRSYEIECANDSNSPSSLL